MSVQENNDGSHISTPTVSEPKSPHSSDYTIYPKFDPNNVTRPPPAPISGDAAGVNPYVSPFSIPKNNCWSTIRLSLNGGRMNLPTNSEAMTIVVRWQSLQDEFNTMCVE
ncbi:hypothetical protein F2Q69_00029467 [Brassica cretica]|uniref:Uncharacterized protein n=1 Tax=Brassica cretica TaxID=69181 RepID=A0A8S9RS35_BRACR|nr:hypothetical protein F2Q69_00029467 [Brassica cretica]